MNASFKQLFADKIIFALFLGSVFFVLLHAIFIAFTFKKIPPFFPLFNQMPWGEARLATKFQILIPFGVILFLGTVNIVIASITYQTMPLVSRFLMVTSFLISSLALLLIVRTVLIIF